MSVFRTSKRRAVDHFHVSDENDLGPEQVELSRQWMKKHHPKAVEVRRPTCQYGCHGYTFADRHGYFNFADKFIEDDFEEVDMGTPRVGDVLVYTRILMVNGKPRRVITHSGKVTDVSHNEVAEVRSKWGGNAELLHAPNDTPRDQNGVLVYGKPTRLLRRLVMPFPLGLTAEDTNMAERSNAQIINDALQELSDPDVTGLVRCASTPELRTSIIEGLQGTQELIKLGPEAAPAVLEFFVRPETQSNHLLSDITLFLLQRLPSEEAVKPLARFLLDKSETIQCGDLRLAAAAFLANAHIEVADEDFVSTAVREAKSHL